MKVRRERGVSPMIAIVIFTLAIAIAFGVLMYRNLKSSVLPLNDIADQALPHKE